MAFEGIVGANSSSDIAIDDIQILPQPCPNPASCDFESDFCTYHNVKTDSFDWVLVSPHDMTHQGIAPPVDHTTSSATGMVFSVIKRHLCLYAFVIIFHYYA